MTITIHDMETIKREIGSIWEYYQSHMDAEIPHLKEEVTRISSQLPRRRAFGGPERNGRR